MSCQMDLPAFNAVLAGLRTSYKIMAPVRLAGQGAFAGQDLITYGEVKKLEDVVFDSKTIFSAKEVVFPPHETLFYFTEEEYKEPGTGGSELLLFARACDINAFERLDSIFLRNGPFADTCYRQRREKIKFVLMECDRGFASCFCASMGTNRTENFSLLCRGIYFSGKSWRTGRKNSALQLPWTGEMPAGKAGKASSPPVYNNYNCPTRRRPARLRLDRRP